MTHKVGIVGDHVHQPIRLFPSHDDGCPEKSRRRSWRCNGGGEGASRDELRRRRVGGWGCSGVGATVAGRQPPARDWLGERKAKREKGNGQIERSESCRWRRCWSAEVEALSADRIVHCTGGAAAAAASRRYRFMETRAGSGASCFLQAAAPTCTIQTSPNELHHVKRRVPTGTAEIYSTIANPASQAEPPGC